MDTARGNGITGKRVLIADPQKLLVDALALTLAGHEVVGVYGEEGEVLRAVRRWSPDLVLLGLHLRGASGVDVGMRLRERTSGPRVLLLVDPQERNALQDVQRSGLGFVPLDATSSRFIAIVESALDGDASVPPVPAPAPWPAPAPVGGPSREAADEGTERLTSRERDVLTLLAEGATNKRIAEILHVRLNTVSAHVKNIYAKLQVHSRVEALVFVLRVDGRLRPPA